MIDGLKCLACAAVLFFAALAPAQAQASKRIAIGYAELENDPRYDPIMAYGRLVLKERHRPFAGAELGIEDADVLKRILGSEFQLQRLTASTPQTLEAEIKNAAAKGVSFFLIDAPADAFARAARAMQGHNALLFNISAEDDSLRSACLPGVVHTLPSLAMRMDALAQYLVSRNWRNVLVLQGPAPTDVAMADAFASAARKFGAKIVARRDYTPGNDPRRRAENNVVLATTISGDYDVVFVADTASAFAREISYQTQRPRPLVGAIGLVPEAWHWTFERYGAPQLNTRFEHLSGRHMEGRDWAAWAAVKLIVQMALRTQSAGFAAQRDYILDEAQIDGGKGVALSVRPWNKQLRQPILLTTPYAVTAIAPLEGFLHRSNTLDTLGMDEEESPCKEEIR